MSQTKDSPDQAPEAEAPRYTAVILTALENEYRAVLAHLRDARAVTGPQSECAYREGTFILDPAAAPDGRAPWRVLIREGGRDQMNAYRATEEAARDWQPDAILFVGVAGGRPEKARHFEVLVGREIAYYEIGKVSADGPRHWFKTAEAEHSRLFEAAKIERDETDAQRRPAWTERVRCGPTANKIASLGISADLRVRMAPIASGEKVVVDPKGALWKEVERNAYRVEAVETEGYGFAFANCEKLDGRVVPRLMIRGISDMMGDKNLTPKQAAKLPKRPTYLDHLDDDERQEIAASLAAAFAYQVLARYGSLYLDKKAPAPSAGKKGLKVELKLDGAGIDKLKQCLPVLLGILESFSETVVIDLREGSLYATVLMGQAGLVILRALEKAGLLSHITGVATTLLDAPVAEGKVDPQVGDVAGAISDLTSREPDIQQRAIKHLVSAAIENPDWGRPLQAVLGAAGETTVEKFVSRQAGLDIALGLAARDPDDLETLGVLFRSYFELGEAAKLAGDIAAARTAYTVAKDIAERLVVRNPADSGWQHDLSLSWDRLGEIAQAEGDLSAARATYAAAKDIVERLVAHDPANSQLQRNLAVCWNKIGDVAQASGDLAAARAAYAVDKDITERLAVRDPANNLWQRDLAVSWDRVGNIAWAEGDLAAARAAYMEARDIRQVLVARDRANMELHRDLSVSLAKLGDIAGAEDDLAAARAAYAAAKDITEALVVRDPANSEWQRGQSVIWAKLGDVALAEGDLAAARTAYAAARDIREVLSARDPANSGWKRDLAFSLGKIGELAKTEGDMQAARSSWQQASELLETLDKAGRLDAQGKQALEALRARLSGPRKRKPKPKPPPA